jgi:hypothetical protein
MLMEDELLGAGAEEKVGLGVGGVVSEAQAGPETVTLKSPVAPLLPEMRM